MLYVIGYFGPYIFSIFYYCRLFGVLGPYVFPDFNIVGYWLPVGLGYTHVFLIYVTGGV